MITLKKDTLKLTKKISFCAYFLKYVSFFHFKVFYVSYSCVALNMYILCQVFLLIVFVKILCLEESVIFYVYFYLPDIIQIGHNIHKIRF